MCTVTFLPTAEGYIFTSNRDETPERSSTPLSEREIGDHLIHFPKDPLAGGTWFATDATAFSLIILNGGFVKHKHRPSYRISRGLVLLDFFKYRNVEKYVSDYDFDGVEPFTLVIAESQDETIVHELVWDEKQLHHKIFHNPEPMIWSSSTLYPDEVRNERKSWFEKWLTSKEERTQKNIIEFHRSGGKGDAWNDFVMDRNGLVQTISITSIEMKDNVFAPIKHEELKRK